MLITTYAPYKAKRGKRLGNQSKSGPPQPVVTLELVAAVYEPGEYVELTFNQAVGTADMDPNAFEISDPEFTSSDYRGDFPITRPTPAKVRMGLVSMGGTAATEVTMTASDETGIEAVNGGGTWAGVTAVELPYSV